MPEEEKITQLKQAGLIHSESDNNDINILNCCGYVLDFQNSKEYKTFHKEVWEYFRFRPLSRHLRDSLCPNPNFIDWLVMNNLMPKAKDLKLPIKYIILYVDQNHKTKHAAISHPTKKNWAYSKLGDLKGIFEHPTLAITQAYGTANYFESISLPEVEESFFNLYKKALPIQVQAVWEDIVTGCGGRI